MPDLRISQLTPSTPQDDDEFAIARSGADNFKLTIAGVRTYYGSEFAPLSHVTDFANPHQVTASQVGAYTTAQADSLFASSSVDVLTTDGDLLTRQSGNYVRKPVGTNGQVWTVVGGAPNWATPAAVSVTLQIGHGFVVGGPITTGMDIGDFYVPVAAGQAVTLQSVRASLSAGTATVALTLKGSTVPGLNSMAVTTTPATFNATTPPSVGDTDDVSLTIIADNAATLLSLTFTLEHTI